MKRSDGHRTDSATDGFWDKRRMIRQSTLKSRERHALHVLADYLGDDDECWPALQTIARDMGISPRQASDVMKRLRDKGVIESKRRGQGHTNLTRIVWENIPADSRRASDLETLESANQELPESANHCQSTPLIGGEPQDGLAESSKSKARPASGQDAQSASNRTSRRTSKRTSKGTKASANGRFDAGTTDIPNELNTPEFRAAWSEWVTYRRQSRHGAVTEPACKKQLKSLSRAGPEAAIASINRAIENDWKGLFPEKEFSRAKKTDDPSRFHAGGDEFNLNIRDCTK